MAYLKIQKGKELIKNQYIDDQVAQKGIRFSLGSLGQVCISLGETKTAGPYTLRLIRGKAVSKQEGHSNRTVAPSEWRLDQLQFSTDKTRPSEPTADAIPDIEGYRIIERLGHGGMGSVWRAEQLSTKREVALKVMATAYDSSSKAQMRFEREVELTASLDHLNIARLYDSGLHHGIYYYAMELLDGISLDRFVLDNRLSQIQILRLVNKICHAVQYAHQRGVIHRDLKPTNILVSPDGEPHIVDFGLARVFWGTQKDMSISIEGEVAGTPAYMAPEQAAGHHDIMDTRSDVFSLGIILFGLLTGESPYDLSGTMVNVLQRIRQGNVRRPRAIKPSIDQDLEAVLLKALALDMDDRYLSAGALADDLINYLNGNPVNAQLPTVFYFLRKKARKYRIQIGVAALAVLIFSGGGLFGYTKWVAYRTRIQEIKIEAERGRLAEERLKWTELELMILGDDKKKARAALRDMRDLHIDALEKNIQLKEDKWQPSPEIRHIGAKTGSPLSLKSLIKRPVLPLDVQSWTIETCAHRGPVQILSSDTKGYHMASCGTDGTIRVWNKDRGELDCIFVPSASKCTDLAWLADSKYLVSCSDRPSAEITVWDVDMQQMICTLPIGESGTDCLALSPDAKYIACHLSASSVIQIWELTEIDTVQLLKALPVEPTRPIEFAWAHDAQSLAMIDNNGRLSVWDVRSGKVVFQLSDNHPKITTMAWSPQDTHLAVSFLSDDQTNPVEIELWDINKKSILESIHVNTFSPTSDPIIRLAWHSNGQSLAYIAKGNTGLWDRETKLVKTLDITNATELTWFNNGSILAIGDSHGSLYCLEKSTGRITQSWISAWCGPAYNAAFSPEGDRLAVLSGSGILSLWETRTWKILGGCQVEGVDHEDHTGRCLLVWSASGNEVGVGTSDGTSLIVFDSFSLRQVRSNEHIQRVKEELDIETIQDERLLSPISSHDASLIATWDHHGKIEIHKQNESPIHCTLLTPETEILSITWSPEDRYILATTVDGTVRVWDAMNDFRGHALLMPLRESPGSGIAFTDGGDFRGPTEIIKQLRYIVQTDHGQKTWRAEEFRNEHGWSNEPWQVGLFEPGAEAIQRIYMKADADGSFRGDGLSWDTAFTDLQDALSKASEGTEIWVAAGTYKPDRGSGLRDASFQLKSDVRLYGGFAGNETSVTQRNADENHAILSGDLAGNDRGRNHNNENSYHVIVAESMGPNALLDGFIITGGNANEPKLETENTLLGHMGGGVLIHSGANLTIQNCVFEYNSASHDGGGLGLSYGTITIENCQFTRNYSGHSGGGATIYGEESRVSYCLFKENQAKDSGGGLYEACDGSLISNCNFLENNAAHGGAVKCYKEKTFVKCRFERNYAKNSGGGIFTLSPLQVLCCTFTGNETDIYGGAISCGGERISIENSGFIGNSAIKSGGAIDLVEGELNIVNCSFVKNSVRNDQEENPGAGGVDHRLNQGVADPDSNATLYLVNSILWGNSNHRGFYEGAQVKAIDIEVNNCCIQGWTGRLKGQGNMGENPQFSGIVGPDNVLGTLDDDLRLSAGSPCIDRGDNALLSLDAYDLDHDRDVNEPLPFDLLDSVRVVGKGVDIGACETSQAR